ncbi:solute carrier family 2, facilitated glucose transporter member 12 [Caerostris extrusa]|uniref:Solute carrier family 2, facilitated glucose transporter member 12 n=1 Tax=Caerostris extrusa TaxID=172846 RepID=A0AAV4QZV4_CAEEX|nr:solute carrier family 2, facilitated glucose transporter member 12 [Caerostris extrusa]
MVTTIYAHKADGSINRVITVYSYADASDNNDSLEVLFQRFLQVMMDKPPTESVLEKIKCQPMYVTFAAIVASVGGILFWIRHSPLGLIWKQGLADIEVEPSVPYNLLTPTTVLSNSTFNEDLKVKFIKHEEHPELLRQLALEIINNISPRALVIYTDGSKSDSGRTGSRIFMKTSTGEFRYRFRNPDHSSVFRSELTAISEALSLALDFKVPDVWILTDSALLQLREDFNLTSFEQAMVVSSVLIGALFASFFGGSIHQHHHDRRRPTSCWYGGITFRYLRMYLYIRDITSKSSGMMVSLNEVGITAGFLVAYLINYIFIVTNNGWRYMFGAAAILALLQGFGVAFLPSSHHYLLVKGKEEKARKVLCLLRNTDDVDKEIESIISSIEEQKNRRYVDLFSTVNNMRSRMLLGMSLVFLQQFSGNANVLYYAPTVFQHFGYDSDTLATLVTIGLGVVKVISTVVTLCIVDKVGRRTLLLIGCLLMATSIMILGTLGTIEGRSSGKPIIIHHTVIINDVSLQSNESTSQETSSKNSIDEDVFEINSLNEMEDLENATQENNLQQMLQLITGQEFDNSEMDVNPFTSENKTSVSNITFDEIKITNNFGDSDATEIFSFLQITENTVSISTIETDSINETVKSKAKENSDLSLPAKITSVVSLMIFVCAYAISYGPVTWLILSEIFPGSLRGRAISVATCVNWGSNIIVSLTFLDIIDAIGIGPTFVVYGFISYGAAIFIFLCLPETKHKTLEEIDALLSKGLIQRNKRLCTFSLIGPPFRFLRGFKPNENEYYLLRYLVLNCLYSL